VPRQGGQSGQASVELIAVLPWLALATLLAVQLALVGWGLWSAGTAARAGARAAFVGGDAERAALDSLPGMLRERARVSGEGPVEVAVSVPAITPGLPRIPLEARAGLDPDGAADG
jgi:hypothetical protein